jgi:hypothetical protein
VLGICELLDNVECQKRGIDPLQISMRWLIDVPIHHTDDVSFGMWCYN